MIVSKITSNAQTTIPLEVRLALGLREGDQVSYDIEKGRVILTRVADMTTYDPFASFSGWGAEADIRAYADF